MVASIPRSRVYCADLYKAGQAPLKNPSSAQKIAGLWARFKQGEQTPALLKQLGVAEGDEAAHRTMISLMKKACKKDVKIEPTEKEGQSGVYFLSRPGRGRFAVFKVGEKRAEMELLARRIAHRIGLPYVSPGVFCTIAYPKFHREATIVELWNGNQKIFKGGEGYRESLYDQNQRLGKPFTITGILEPYFEPQKKDDITPADFASMTTLALAIGLRDAKCDGIGIGKNGAILFDTEECMPTRLLPDKSPNQCVAATHLPYLAHALAKKPIPPETIQMLREKIEPFARSLNHQMSELGQETILFPDEAAEDLVAIEDVETVIQKLRSLGKKPLAEFGEEEFARLRAEWNPVDYDFDLESVLEIIEQCRAQGTLVNRFGFCHKGWDHGGCSVFVEKTPQVMEKVPVVHVGKKRTLLSEGQISALSDRVGGLQDFFTKSCGAEKKGTTVLDLVRRVDPLYDAHLDALEKTPHDPAHTLFTVGRVTPACSAPLDKTALFRILTSPTHLRRVASEPSLPPPFRSEEGIRQRSFTEEKQLPGLKPWQPGLRLRDETIQAIFGAPPTPLPVESAE